MALKGNDHSEFGLHENTTRCRGRYLLQPRREMTSFSLPKGQLASDRVAS